MRSAQARSSLNSESWEDLYDFLDPGRKERPASERDALAGARCQEIRRKLACFFAARGCADAEDLAMDTLLRVAAKCRGVDSSGFADRTGYFYGVARNVLHEWQRRSSADAEGRESLRVEFLRLPVPDADAWAEEEAVHRYLGLCLTQLTERARSLILSYYAEEGGAKVAHHRTLAAEFGKSVNSLRIEVHRIRKTVRECVFQCLRGRSASGGPREDAAD
jgi:RNA polymerase sigma factor (sigma-70 family)